MEGINQKDRDHILKILVELTSSLRHAKLIATAEAIDKLGEQDLVDLGDAIRLIRDFINNV